MTIFNKIPDEQYIDKLRKANSFRFKAAIIYLLSALIFLIPAIYYGTNIYNESLDYIDHLERQDARNISNNEMAEIESKSNFYFGIAIGSGLISALYVGLFPIIMIFKLYIGGRKETMLVKYYDLSKDIK